MRLYRKMQDYLLSPSKGKISRLTLGMIFAGGFLSLYGLDSLKKEVRGLDRELNNRTIQQEIVSGIYQMRVIELTRENQRLKKQMGMEDYPKIKKFPIKI